MTDLERISIRLALEDLNAAFAFHLDHNQLEPLVDLFSVDALYLHGTRRSDGRSAIRNLFTTRAAGGIRTTRHCYSGLQIDIEDDRNAKGRSVCVTFAANAAPPISNTAPYLVADFIDEYLLDSDQKWRIARREIHRIFATPESTEWLAASR
jgi:hypothetical protein